MVYKVESLNEKSIKIIVKFTKEEFNKALEKHNDKQGQEQINEAMNDLIRSSYSQIVVHEKIDVVGYPSIALSNEIDDTYTFAYEASVELMPKLVLNQYTGLNVKLEQVSVSNEEVEKEINASLVKFATDCNVTGPLKEGQIAIIDFVGKKDGVPFEGGTGSNYPLEIGSHTFVPGFEEQMIGMQINETKDLNITFPKNYHADLANKDVIFTVTVHEIKEKVVPSLTDELVANLKIESVNTVEEYRQYISLKLHQEKTAKANDVAIMEVFKRLKEANPYEVPSFYVEQYVSNQLERVKAQANQYQIPVEVLLQYTGFESVEAFKQSYAEVAKNHLHEQVILKEIIMKEKLQATLEEIEAAYVSYAKQNNMDLAEFKEKYKEEQILESILMEKGARFVIEMNIGNY